MRLHHVQLSLPPGGEEQARHFWVRGMGMAEVPKPAELAGRGGCWFRLIDAAGVVLSEVHCGVEQNFTPATKAHPAFLVESMAALEELAQHLESVGSAPSWAERHTFEGYERFHARDPFGNRVEVLCPAPVNP